MKKLFSTMIALAMLAATPLTVFATGSSSNTGGNTEIDVNGKYIEGNAATMISVDITWDDMSFEYNDGERTWDPNKHEYITSGGSWTSEKKTVNVKNHSNTAVKAEFSFASSLDGITGSFDNKTLQLETAVGKAVENAPAASTNFGISGSKINTDAKLGTITLNISADTNSDVTVPEESSDVKLEQNTSGVTSQGDGITTYEQLAKAIKNGGDIKLDGDIKITKPIAIEGSVTIDLNNRTLIGNIGNSGTMFTAGKEASFTLSNGNIELNEGCCVTANGAQKVKFIKCKANISTGMLCSTISSTIALDECDVTGNGTLIEMSSASKLDFIRKNSFIGDVSKGSDCIITISNAGGSTFGFDPSNYINYAATIEKNDAENTWTVVG